MSGESAVYFDPYDFEIHADPFPVYRRLREQAPLYYNERYDFYLVSRYDDVEQGLKDWQTFPSGRGVVLEQIKSGMEFPPGTLIFEDPPAHEIRRAMLSRIFTPRRMEELEFQAREFCARCLDPLVGTGRFDFVRDLGAQMPMRVIGMLLGIPEEDQEALRDQMDADFHLETGEAMPESPLTPPVEMFAEYIDWRAQHPSDDLMTKLLTAEFEDENGTTRTLTRSEVLAYVAILASAGNETTTRLIGWAGKTLADHPDQRKELVEDRSLIKGAIEELLSYEPPAPNDARSVARDVEYYGQTVPEGSAMMFLIAAANRDERRFPDPDRFDIHRNASGHLAFGYGIHYCLGAALARLEGRVALDEVLQRFPEWEVDWDGAEMSHTSTVRGWDSLPVLTP